MLPDGKRLAEADALCSHPAISPGMILAPIFSLDSPSPSASPMLASPRSRPLALSAIVDILNVC